MFSKCTFSIFLYYEDESFNNNIFYDSWKAIEKAINSEWFYSAEFLNAPTIAALAVLSQLKKEVARVVETKALDQLASLGGAEKDLG